MKDEAVNYWKMLQEASKNNEALPRNKKHKTHKKVINRYNAHYTTPEQMLKMYDKYFAHCYREVIEQVKDAVTGEVENIVKTIMVDKPKISTLIPFLGLHKSTYYEYKKNPKFSSIMERASSVIEAGYENNLSDGKKAAGAKFALMQFGWKEKSETEVKTTSYEVDLTSLEGTDTPLELDESDDYYLEDGSLHDDNDLEEENNE